MKRITFETDDAGATEFLKVASKISAMRALTIATFPDLVVDKDHDRTRQAPGGRRRVVSGMTTSKCATEFLQAHPELWFDGDQVALHFIDKGFAPTSASAALSHLRASNVVIRSGTRGKYKFKIAPPPPHRL